MQVKFTFIFILIFQLSACQLISPIFVNYNGVRMDVAKWINQQTLMSMQQKRTLAQLSRAQQKLVRIDQISADQKLGISKENAIAMHCAQLKLSQKKIQQLQIQVFGADQKELVLNTFEQNFPKLKLDPNTIQCE